MQIEYLIAILSSPVVIGVSSAVAGGLISFWAAYYGNKFGKLKFFSLNLTIKKCISDSFGGFQTVDDYADAEFVKGSIIIDIFNSSNRIKIIRDTHLLFYGNNRFILKTPVTSSDVNNGFGENYSNILPQHLSQYKFNFYTNNLDKIKKMDAYNKCFFSYKDDKGKEKKVLISVLK